MRFYEQGDIKATSGSHEDKHMIIYGWGKDFKEVAYAGIERCLNCGNFGHFWICEQASFASLYFVKVLKWNKRLFLMCQTCQRGWEIEAKDRQSILRSTVGLPTPQECEAIWGEVEKAVSLAASISQASHIEPTTGFWQNTLESIVTEVGRRHDSEHVRYILGRYLTSLRPAHSDNSVIEGNSPRSQGSDGSGPDEAMSPARSLESGVGVDRGSACPSKPQSRDPGSLSDKIALFRAFVQGALEFWFDHARSQLPGAYELVRLLGYHHWVYTEALLESQSGKGWMAEKAAKLATLDFQGIQDIGAALLSQKIIADSAKASTPENAIRHAEIMLESLGGMYNKSEAYAEEWLSGPFHK